MTGLNFSGLDRMLSLQIGMIGIHYCPPSFSELPSERRRPFRQEFSLIGDGSFRGVCSSSSDPQEIFLLLFALHH